MLYMEQVEGKERQSQRCIWKKKKVQNQSFLLVLQDLACPKHQSPEVDSEML